MTFVGQRYHPIAETPGGARGNTVFFRARARYNGTFSKEKTNGD